MSYRDDRDADQARIAALEADLKAAHRKIDDLEGRRSQALVRGMGTALAGRPDKKIPWYGATRHELVATFEGEYPRDAMETLIEEIRALTGDHGRSELFRSSLTWSSSTDQRTIGPFIMISVMIRDGSTTLTAKDQLKALAGGIYGGVGAGVGIGGILVPVFAALAAPVLTPVIAIGWLAGIGLGTRALFTRASRKRAARLQIIFDGLGASIAATIAATPPRPG